MRVVWTRAAREDRRAIRAYIAAESPRAAIQLDQRFSVAAERLIDRPCSGRPGRVPGTRELVAHRNYVVVYDVVADAVRVLRILHVARRWPPERSF